MLIPLSQYLKRSDRIDASPATLRKYIDNGIIKGRTIRNGKKNTYYVETDESRDDLLMRAARG